MATYARLLLSVVISMLAITTAFDAVAADTVATCKDPSGYANYHYAGLVQKKDSGFDKDKISGGLTTLVRIGKGEYDLLFVDVRKSIISTKQDGGQIRLIRRGTNDATFLVITSSFAIELFTFYKDAEGLARYDLIQSKGGDRLPIHKSAVMAGTCSELNLNLLD